MGPDNQDEQSGDGQAEPPELHEIDIASLHAPPAEPPAAPPDQIDLPSAEDVLDRPPPPPETVPEAPPEPEYQSDEFDSAEEEAAYEDARQRRRNVRINIRCPVTVRIDGYEPLRSRARDMSATGVGFSTRLPLVLDMEGRVTMHFENWTFTKEFIVRFARPIIAGKHVGVEFKELTQEEHERIVKEVFALQRSALRAERAK